MGKVDRLKCSNPGGGRVLHRGSDSTHSMLSLPELLDFFAEDEDKFTFLASVVLLLVFKYDLSFLPLLETLMLPVLFFFLPTTSFGCRSRNFVADLVALILIDFDSGDTHLSLMAVLIAVFAQLLVFPAELVFSFRTGFTSVALDLLLLLLFSELSLSLGLLFMSAPAELVSLPELTSST